MEDGSIVLEGPILLEEARRSGWRIRTIFASETARERWPELLKGAVPVANRAVEAVAATEASQGVISLVKPEPRSFGDMLTGSQVVLVLDGIQDPGNAGTLVRSAEAFAATGVVACSGSVRIANGKFLRATAGSVFRVPFVEHASAQDTLSFLKQSKLNLFALDARADLSIHQVDLGRSCALVVGNEGNGVSGIFRGAATAVSIPVAGVESLNAAVAGSVALFESSRQRSSR